MRTETADPIAAFNTAHPARVRPAPEPLRFTGGPAPAEVTGFAVGAAPKFRGVRSTRTGVNRTWRNEIRTPR